MLALKNGTLAEMVGDLAAEQDVRETLRTDEWLKWLEK